MPTSDVLATGVAIPPIPEFPHAHGPITRAVLRRSFLLMAPFWGVGILLLLVDASPRLTAFGLGLLVPGGGLLYAGHVILAVAVFLAVPVAIGVWWLCGMVVLPPAVWLGGAVLAAAIADGGVYRWAEWLVPAMLLVVVLVSLGYPQVRFRVLRRRGARYNRKLAELRPHRPADPTAPRTREATADDLKSLRYVLDLALQPIDEWAGFHFVRSEQFREGAVRYQLNFVSYTAAMYQYACAPAFTGYVAEAQRNAIQKMLDKSVWSYWWLENLWGQLRWNPDPIVDDNVMYSAYLGLMLGLYETVTGDRRYQQPGCLALRWSDGRVFRHDAATIATALVDNFERSRFGLFPCEPNWIYPMCNAFATSSLLVYDRLHQTAHAPPIIERAHRGFDTGDFCEPDGRLTLTRSEYFGFRHPMVGNLGDAIATMILNPGLPDIARRTWWLNRTFHLGPEDSPAEVTHRAWNRLDPGNYGLNDGFTRAALAANAREFGDEHIYVALLDSLSDRIVDGGGARRYKGMSVWGNLWLTLARFGGEDALRALVCDGFPPSWRTGPILAEAAYPDVLVARAVTDGRALDLVLRPGNGGNRTTLRIGRLEPNRAYDTAGAVERVATADSKGEALIDVDLDDRLEVHISPTS